MLVEIDKKIIDNILKKSDFKTAEEVVDVALKQHLKKLTLKELANLRGKITWEGNLDEMREC